MKLWRNVALKEGAVAEDRPIAQRREADRAGCAVAEKEAGQ